MDLENWNLKWRINRPADTKQSPTNLALFFEGVNCLVVFPTHFNLNNSLLKLLQISLLFKWNPALSCYCCRSSLLRNSIAIFELWFSSVIFQKNCQEKIRWSCDSLRRQEIFSLSLSNSSFSWWKWINVNTKQIQETKLHVIPRFLAGSFGSICGPHLGSAFSSGASIFSRKQAGSKRHFRSERETSGKEAGSGSSGPVWGSFSVWG